MLVRDIMTREVVSVTPDVSVGMVAKLLMENRFHGVPVVEDKKLVGIITETDFFTKGSMRVYLPEYIDFLKKDTVLGKTPATDREKIDSLLNTKAADIMTSPCITVREDSDIIDFFSLVRDKKLTSVPVTDGEENLAGIITLSDVINLININS